jgi:hypothetical protein
MELPCHRVNKLASLRPENKEKSIRRRNLKCKRTCLRRIVAYVLSIDTKKHASKSREAVPLKKYVSRSRMFG